jgi:hypothetical protein
MLGLCPAMSQLPPFFPLIPIHPLVPGWLSDFSQNATMGMAAGRCKNRK